MPGERRRARPAVRDAVGVARARLRPRTAAEEADSSCRRRRSRSASSTATSTTWPGGLRSACCSTRGGARPETATSTLTAARDVIEQRAATADADGFRASPWPSARAGGDRRGRAPGESPLECAGTPDRGVGSSLALERRPHAGGREREPAHALAGRVEDRVGDRRRTVRDQHLAGAQTGWSLRSMIWKSSFGIAVEADDRVALPVLAT